MQLQGGSSDRTLTRANVKIIPFRTMEPTAGTPAYAPEARTQHRHLPRQLEHRGNIGIIERARQEGLELRIIADDVNRRILAVQVPVQTIVLSRNNLKRWVQQMILCSEGSCRDLILSWDAAKNKINTAAKLKLCLRDEMLVLTCYVEIITWTESWEHRQSNQLEEKVKVKDCLSCIMCTTTHLCNWQWYLLVMCNEWLLRANRVLQILWVWTYNGSNRGCTKAEWILLRLNFYLAFFSK